MMSSALYVGSVQHRRTRPRPHRLRYRVFWMLLDLDEIETLGRRLRLFSCRGFNLFQFRTADYGSGSDEPLRAQAERHLTAAGIDLGGGPIRLLCMPRILGYAFNPLSVYFCHHQDGSLGAILYEVHNTFGERHAYLARVDGRAAPTLRQHGPKEFYVSPFIPVAMRYAFRVAPPGATVAVAIRTEDAQGPVLLASLVGRRVALSDAALVRVFVTHPLLTLKVIGAIHFEALRLWWKGVPVLTHPPPPSRPVTLIEAEG